MMTAHPTVGEFCGNEPAKATAQFECGQSKTDTEGDSMADCVSHKCSVNPLKMKSGVCGCGTPDIDTVSDGTYDYKNQCSKIPLGKTLPGACGCGIPGECGCGIPDMDMDGNTFLIAMTSAGKTHQKDGPGACGTLNCDLDSDGILDSNDFVAAVQK